MMVAWTKRWVVVGRRKRSSWVLSRCFGDRANRISSGLNGEHEGMKGKKDAFKVLGLSN